MRTSSGLDPRNEIVAPAPRPPRRVTLAPGTSTSRPPRSSRARGLSAGRSTDEAAARSSRAACGAVRAALTTDWNGGAAGATTEADAGVDPGVTGGAGGTGAASGTLPAVAAVTAVPAV